ncbi:MAG: hypothetical protein GF353_27125 [Candidatus Lokiarchaeota archaeon]|nr:hypothetical protein [Candidatus Lokiarchaeota archaeon]
MMKLKDKKVYFILSPHINYYHSYRGDFSGNSGFGKDVRIMELIINQLDDIEDRGFSFGDMRITWDYADTFWSIQLQQEYQPDILERVIERCKKGKDEVLIGSWGNTAQPALDTEEFIQDQKWLLENEMGIGLKQLFPGRIAPYCRPQEVMFTQGMIELYNQVGIEGFCLYYSVYQFDVMRPFLNPRLTANQRYGILNLKSSISDASCLLIPTYAFGDLVDFFSIKRWFEHIRKLQESGEIEGHALVFFNFDMDTDLWTGIPLPKQLKWMPNSGGLMEFAEAVDLYDYVEFGNLLDVVPKLKAHGSTILRLDTADGYFNGFYNWAQKYTNTKFWTYGQQARWIKSISDTLISKNLVKKSVSEINKNLRKGNDLDNTYLKNKILFASTTNFGLAMPFLHPHRQKTAISYIIKAMSKALDSAVLAKNELIKNFHNFLQKEKNLISVIPITKRGISERESLNINSPILFKFKIPKDNFIDHTLLNQSFALKSNDSEGKIPCAIYQDQKSGGYYLQGIISKSEIQKNKFCTLDLTPQNIHKLIKKDTQGLMANQNLLKNRYIKLELNDKGKINSLKYKNQEFACSHLLLSSVSFGKRKNGKNYSSSRNDVEIIRDGSDGFSASVKLISKFEIFKDSPVVAEKTLTLYSELPYLFVKVKIEFCDIRGEEVVIDGTSYVQEKFDKRWKEIIPCEVRPNIVGKKNHLRVWKRNFLGAVSHFDLDMKEVDKRNKDIDCLVANISDGWMAVSNKEKGLLIGFNSLKAANFAFSPIRIRDKGFKDAEKKGQQIRINPFGVYFGKSLHYWTDGSGHAMKIIPKLWDEMKSTAPTYSGKNMTFDLILAPYLEDRPPSEVQSFVDHFSLPPLIFAKWRNDNYVYDNFSHFETDMKELIGEYDLENVLNLSYMDWVKKINKDYDPSYDSQITSEKINYSIGLILRLLIDGLRGR